MDRIEAIKTEIAKNPDKARARAEASKELRLKRKEKEREDAAQQAQQEYQRKQLAEEEEKQMLELPPTPQRCPGRQPIGMANLGNSCFFNSVVQVLASSAPLTEAIVQQRLHEKEAVSGANQQLVSEFARIVQDLQSRPFPGFEDDGWQRTQAHTSCTQNS